MVSLVNILGAAAKAETGVRTTKEAKEKEESENLLALLLKGFKPAQRGAPTVQPATEFLGLPAEGRLQVGQAPPTARPRLEAPIRGALPEGAIGLPKTLAGVEAVTPPAEEKTLEEKIAEIITLMQVFGQQGEAGVEPPPPPGFE